MAKGREPLRSIHAGLGGRGRTHLRAALGCGFWQPVALVDPDPAALHLAREVANLPQSACFARLEDALNAVPADVRGFEHHPHARAALAGDLRMTGDQVDTLANMRIYRDFYVYIVEGVEPESSGRRNLETLRVLEAVQRSSESGRAVSPSALESESRVR